MLEGIGWHFMKLHFMVKFQGLRVGRARIRSSRKSNRKMGVPATFFFLESYVER